MKILIADDTLVVRILIKKFVTLVKPGQEIVFLEAEDGQQAFDLFKKEKPNLMTLDLLMPVLEGTLVLKQIKAENKDHNCFIVVFSSNFQKPVKERVLKFGANLFVEKPASFEKFVNIFAEYEKYRIALK